MRNRKNSLTWATTNFDNTLQFCNIQHGIFTQGLFSLKFHLHTFPPQILHFYFRNEMHYYIEELSQNGLANY